MTSKTAVDNKQQKKGKKKWEKIKLNADHPLYLIGLSSNLESPRNERTPTRRRNELSELKRGDHSKPANHLTGQHTPKAEGRNRDLEHRTEYDWASQQLAEARMGEIGVNDQKRNIYGWNVLILFFYLLLK